MIRQILGWLLATIVIVAIIVWIVGGGLTRAIAYARGLSDFHSYLNINATSSGQEFRLPGQPDFSSYAANTLQTDTGYHGDTGSYSDNTSYAYAQSPNSFGPQDDPRTFGNPSPYAGRIAFTGHSEGAPSVDSEYLALTTSPAATSPIPMGGWTLQSALTGARVLLPQATSQFVQGVLNHTDAVSLTPGSTIIIVSGNSPVGVSFRENRCSGYLAQFQTFTPPLSNDCPSATENAQVQSSDPACVHYLTSIPSCHFPGGAGAQNPSIPNNCRTLAANILSYNGCVSAYHSSSDFLSPSWRLYLSVEIGRAHV